MTRGCALDGSTSAAWISEDWQRRNGEATGSFGTAPSRNGWFDGSLVRAKMPIIHQTLPSGNC